MAEIIDGKLVSASVRKQLAEETAALREKGIVPGLAVVMVGEDPASSIYVRNKEKACEEIGIYSEIHKLPEDTTEESLLDLLRSLNTDCRIDGVIVQLPLPSGISGDRVINCIDPDKDVDAFHPLNVGKILIGNFCLLPFTPAGVMKLLDYYGIEVSGKDCVVIGRSNIVGKPQAALLMHRNGTVTVCHSKTADIIFHTAKADIIVVAVRKPGFLTGDMIKEGAVVIDVGINRDENGKICGDVDFASVREKASFITPVPGGVGPMTVTMLMQNTVTAAKMHHGILNQ